jgi:predicted RNA binding protein YcfA (HicA-like mRNA interferase family)
MPKLRRLTGREVLKILHQLGFMTRRVTGSHHQLRKQTENHTCNTTVPVHGNTALATGTLKSIIAQVSLCLEASEIDPFYE